MNIKSFQGGYDNNLCYLIWCEETKLAGIVDPSVSPEFIFDFVNNNNLKIDKILITHTHHAHIQYLNEICGKYPNAISYSKYGVKKIINWCSLFISLVASL